MNRGHWDLLSPPLGPRGRNEGVRARRRRRFQNEDR